MDNDVMIKVEGISKKYCKSLKRSMLYGVTDIGRNMLGLNSHSGKLRKNEFWAVEDISFEVKRGETLGLIGLNGSGKTTLLKMLNGIFWPDKGKISVKGRVGALIAVGAGFHPMLTGRENIYINGAISGMTKREIDKKFDEIVDFADIGEFLDSPVKHYSSGMYVRLGFAIAVHCEPDILLVDEVLAVGDTEFQSKCYSKMARLIGQGKTIILVSHSMDTIRHVCKKAVFLRKGKVEEIGDSNTVVLNYLNHIQQEEVEKSTFPIEKQRRNNGIIRTIKKGRIKKVYFLNEQNLETNNFKTGDTIKIRIDYEAYEEIEHPIFAVNFHSNQILYTSFISDGSFPSKSIKGNGIIELYLPHAHFPAEVYSVSAVLSQNVEFNHIDWYKDACFIKVNKRESALGLIDLPHKWFVLKKDIV